MFGPKYGTFVKKVKSLRIIPSAEMLDEWVQQSSSTLTDEHIAHNCGLYVSQVVRDTGNLLMMLEFFQSDAPSTCVDYMRVIIAAISTQNIYRSTGTASTDSICLNRALVEVKHPRHMNKYSPGIKNIQSIPHQSRCTVCMCEERAMAFFHECCNPESPCLCEKHMLVSKWTNASCPVHNVVGTLVKIV